MNKDVFAENKPRYERLAKPKERADRNINFNAFKVKREALSYQITDSLNKLAQPKRRTSSDLSNGTTMPSRPARPSIEKQRYHRLINSSEQSKDAQESRKKKFPLDTYARITAARNKKCSKRLQELARPKQQHSGVQIPGYEDHSDYFRTIKTYDPKSGTIFARSK